MSKEQVASSEQQEAQSGEQGSNQEQEAEQYVPRKSYEEVVKDLHKFKSRWKETEAKISEYDAKLKAHEEEKLKEQQKWKELYDRAKKEKEQTLQERQREKELYFNAVKKSALKSELGGKIKDVYLSHANVQAIELTEDGEINPESLRTVANQFRQDFPELIPASGSSNITGRAPQDAAPKTEKTVAEMTLQEKRDALLQRRLEKFKQ